MQNTHRDSGGDDLCAVFDDDAQVWMRVRDDDRRCTDPASDVDEHRALREVFPRKPYTHARNVRRHTPLPPRSSFCLRSRALHYPSVRPSTSPLARLHARGCCLGSGRLP